METKEKIIIFLKEKYDPTTLMIYGSYANGDYDDASDFDCLVITNKKKSSRDDGIIFGVPLDCCVYTKKEIESLDLENFIKIHDAEIIFDDGYGRDLRNKVLAYRENSRVTSDSTKQEIISWVTRTIRKIRKNDDDGNFRAVVLLWTGLFYYFSLRDMVYYGSKKSIKYLKENDLDGYIIFHDAITSRSIDDIIRWATYVITL